jgi:hypothetical protein
MRSRIWAVAIAMAALATVAVFALAGCGGAQGGIRPPTATERTQLVHFMRFWWKNSDSFRAVRTFTLHIDRLAVSRRDPHFATVNIHSVDPATGYRPEPQKLGFMLWGGVWEIVVGPGDWSGTCTRPSPQPLVDLYCS